jgi:hypothetical protein
MLSIAIAAGSVARAADPAPSSRPSLVAVESLVVDVLSDDVSDTYVTKTSFATSELSNVVAAGATVVSGETLCVANLGYGLRLRTRVGDTEHVLLFKVTPPDEHVGLGLGKPVERRRRPATVRCQHIGRLTGQHPLQVNRLVCHGVGGD